MALTLSLQRSSILKYDRIQISSSNMHSAIDRRQRHGSQRNGEEHRPWFISLLRRRRTCLRGRKSVKHKWKSPAGGVQIRLVESAASATAQRWRTALASLPDGTTRREFSVQRIENSRKTDLALASTTQQAPE